MNRIAEAVGWVVEHIKVTIVTLSVTNRYTQYGEAPLGASPIGVSSVTTQSVAGVAL